MVFKVHARCKQKRARFHAGPCGKLAFLSGSVWNRIGVKRRDRKPKGLEVRFVAYTEWRWRDSNS